MQVSQSSNAKWSDYRVRLTYAQKKMPDRISRHQNPGRNMDAEHTLARSPLRPKRGKEKLDLKIRL